MKHGKKYVESTKLVESTKVYESAEAFDLVCKTAKAKFDETVELHVRLGVDSRHADQQVRGAVVLPNGTGKKVRTLVFCKADRSRLPRTLAQITSLTTTPLLRSTAAGWTSKLLSQLPI